MKKIILLFILFQSGNIFAQKAGIDKSMIVPTDIDFKGCVKKITLKNFRINKIENKIDTVKTISEISFSEKGTIALLKDYKTSFNDLWRIVEFDQLGRITTLSQKKGDKILPFEKIYFSTKREFPDSILSYNYEGFKGKLLNHFKENLVRKQEYFINDSLNNYSDYIYNSQNQLIQEVYVEPNKNEETKIFENNSYRYYRGIVTRYEYEKINDTVITITLLPKSSSKTVRKNIKTDKFSLEIREDYKTKRTEEYLLRRMFTYNYNDSKNLWVSTSYNDKNEIINYYKIVTTTKKIIRKWKFNMSKKEQSKIIKISLVYDWFGNWIKKSYSLDNSTNVVLEREIEYYH